MAAAADRLPEPQVLARAKRRLFPDEDESDTYAVVDTQFATEEWLDGRRVDRTVRETLAPFNHVRIGSGYPDLVGVRKLEAELLAVERFGAEPPLVVVEAKGHTGRGVDTSRGDRPGPRSPGRGQRRLPRRARRGLHRVRPHAGPGTQRGDPRRRTRGRGRAPGGAPGRRQPHHQRGDGDPLPGQRPGRRRESFGLNHPKNYLAYPLAVRHAGETRTLVEDNVVGAVEDARRGAAFLGLIDGGPAAGSPRGGGSGPALTPLGREVVRFARTEHGSLDAALRTFEDWKGSRKRFYDLAPRWGLVARRVVFDYPATELLVEELGTMHEDGVTEPSLVDLVEWCHAHHPSFTVELFLGGEEAVRSRALAPDGELRRAALEDGGIYHAPTVFQLKAMLYHAGILTERGAEPSRIDPTGDVWRLREPA